MPATGGLHVSRPGRALAAMARAEQGVKGALVSRWRRCMAHERRTNVAGGGNRSFSDRSLNDRAAEQATGASLVKRTRRRLTWLGRMDGRKWRRLAAESSSLLQASLSLSHSSWALFISGSLPVHPSSSVSLRFDYQTTNEVASRNGEEAG